MILRRGISAVIAGVIVLALFVSIVIPFTLFIFRSMNDLGASLSSVIQLEQQRELETLRVSYEGTNLTIVNIGSVPIGVRYLLLEFTTNGSKVILDLYNLSTTAGISGIPTIELDGASPVRTGYVGYIVIQPGGRIEIELPSLLKPKILVTTSGKVVNIEKLVSISKAAKSVRVVPITFSNIANLASLLEQSSGIVLTTNPSSGITESTTTTLEGFANRSGGSLILAREYHDVHVRLRLGFWSSAMGNIVVGYSPGQDAADKDRKMYSILITATDLNPAPDDEEGVIEIENYVTCSFEPSTGWSCNGIDHELWSKLVNNDNGDNFEGGFRIFIEGLDIADGRLNLTIEQIAKLIDLSELLKHPSSPLNLGSDILRESITVEKLYGNETLGFHFYCGRSGWGSNGFYETRCILDLEGVAKRIAIYVSSSEAEQQVEGNASPFFFFADTDGNGIPEMVFITEDFSFGDMFTLGDRYPDTVFDEPQFTALDVTKPLWFVFKSPKYAIDSSRYSQIIVTLRIYFHDNAASDTNEVSDPKKFLLEIALVDPDTGQIVSSSALIYQQLDDIEDTWPPNTNFVTLTIPLIVPNTGKVYYVALAFQDPYWYDGAIDDVDFTLAVEWIGISFFYRG